MTCDLVNDCLSINHSQHDESIHTKRGALQVAARVYDPLGLFSAATLRAKLELQTMWQQKLDWDDELSESEKTQWSEIMSDLSTIPHVKIPRYIGSKQAQLFCLTNALAKAYATNTYLGSSAGVCLVFSKSKVAPVKQVTLPRLELLGVLIGVQSLKYVSQHMKIKVEEKILWTDLQVVLNWLKTIKPLSVFVKNRVTQITNGGDISFCYISSQENPVDMAFQGLEVNNLQHSFLWWHDPVWLCFEKDRWPTWGIPEVNSQILQDIQYEYRTSIVFSTVNLVGEGPTEMECLPPLEIGINQFSTLHRLVCVTAWCMRFIGNLKGE